MKILIVKRKHIKFRRVEAKTICNYSTVYARSGKNRDL